MTVPNVGTLPLADIDLAGPGTVVQPRLTATGGAVAITFAQLRLTATAAAALRAAVSGLDLPAGTLLGTASVGLEVR